MVYIIYELPRQLIVVYQLHIVFMMIGQGSWSYLGTDATRVPKESFTMNLGFVDRPTVLHEFGHTLGLIHEHQSPFPGGFEWDRENVSGTIMGMVLPLLYLHYLKISVLSFTLFSLDCALKRFHSSYCCALPYSLLLCDHIYLMSL